MGTSRGMRSSWARFVGRHPRGVLLIASLAVLSCGQPGDGSIDKRSSALMADGVQVAIDWWMPEFFGTQFDKNGIPLLAPAPITPGTWGAPITGNPMRPSAWNVMLNGCTATAARSYTWDIALPTTNVHVSSGSSCIQWVGFPTQGSFWVTLTMGFADGSTAVGSQLVTVKNYLVVSMGDSLASGEGDPDVPAGGLQPAIWADRRCHRSALSGHAAAAQALEDADYHSSVRFISVACSGAGINQGILGTYMGEDPPSPTPPPLPTQMSQVASLVCPWIGVPPGQTVPPCDPIDALVLTIGANDAGFGDVVRACANPFTNCALDSSFTGKITTNIKNLGGRYSLLNTAIKQNLNVKQVYFAEYEDPTHDHSGNLCSQMLFKGAVTDNYGFLTTAAGSIGVGLSDGQINASEVTWAHDSVLVPLNLKALGASNAFGWKYIGGIADAFRTHGYCATAQKWMETYDESKRDEGPGKVDGTMHPNDFGYQAIGEYIFASLAEDLTTPRPLVASAPLPNGQIRLFGRGTDNVIDMQTFTGSGWNAWQPMGDFSTAPPTAVTLPGNSLAFFEIDTSGFIQGKYFNPVAGWRPRQTLTNSTIIIDPKTKTFSKIGFQGKPTAIARASGVIDLFVRGTDAKLWHLKITSVDANGFVSGNWEPTNSPPYVGTPSAVAGGPNELDVVAVGPDSIGNFSQTSLWHGFLHSGVWTWEDKGPPVGGPIRGNPTLVSWGPTRLDMFVNGADQQLWHLWFDGGWGRWEPLGNYLTSDPQATTMGVNRLDIVARGPDLGVWVLTFDGRWEEWEQLQIPAESGIAADAIGPGHFDLYAQYPGGGVYSAQLDQGLLDTFWLGGVVK
jgi:hypothetical protein